MKQSVNGTTLIGGGWKVGGLRNPDAAIVPSTLITNLRLARYALPALAQARLVRAWTGFEAHAPDS